MPTVYVSRSRGPKNRVVDAAIVVGALLLAGCASRHDSAKEKSAAPPPVAVTTAPVTLRPLQRTVHAVGTLHGYDEVTITPKVEGRIQKIHHDVGDAVKPGEILLDIDPVDHQLAYQEAKKALELELAKLGLEALPPTAPDLTKLPSIVRATNVEANAFRKLERAQKLRIGGSMGQEELDQFQTDYKVSQSAREQAEMEARATLASARHRQAALAMAEQRLKDTRVIAPSVAGKNDLPGDLGEWVVCQRLVSEGEMVRAFPSMAVFKVVRDRFLKLKTTVPERHAAEVQMGQTVEVRVEAFPDKVFEGKIIRVNPTVDPTSRTFEVEALVPNEKRQIKAGSFARTAILTRVEAQGRTVPVEAVVTFAGVTKIFEVHDGQARAVEVKLGVRGRGWVEIIGDVRPDAVVVLTGHSALADGTPVRIREK